MILGTAFARLFHALVGPAAEPRGSFISGGAVIVSEILKVKGHTVLTIKPTETVGTLARRLQQERIGAMIVSQDGESLDGIVSERDIAYGLAARRGELHRVLVSVLMTKNVERCSPEDRIVDVAKVMTQRHIRHLPVTQSNRLVGVISIRDVLQYRLNDIQRQTDLLRKCVVACE